MVGKTKNYRELSNLYRERKLFSSLFKISIVLIILSVYHCSYTMNKIDSIDKCLYFVGLIFINISSLMVYIRDTIVIRNLKKRTVRFWIPDDVSR